MAKIIIIGRGAQSNVIFKKTDISATHARITDLGGGKYKVEDLDSSNGVYVNGYRIKTIVVSLQDEVRLSASHVINLKKVFSGITVYTNDIATPQSGATKVDAKDFVEEFKKLKPLYSDYTKSKKKVIEGNQRKQALIYLAFMAVPLLVQWKTEDLAFSGATVILGGLARLMPGGTKYLDKIEELTDNFMIRYVCPNRKCNQALFGRSWKVWDNTGECPRCKAKFNENKL